MRLRSSKKQIAYDQIPEESVIRRMYEDDATLALVAVCARVRAAVPPGRPAGGARLCNT